MYRSGAYLHQPPQWRKVVHPLEAQRRRGFTLVYICIALTLLIGFVSFSVDWGRVQVAKQELQLATDAAARGAAAQLLYGVAAVQNAAVTWAGHNKCDGSTVVIDPTNDVVFGTWDSTNRTFTVLTGSAQSAANAVQINAHRTAARGTAIALTFAPIIGRSTCDVNASTTVTSAAPNGGFTGLQSVSCGQDFFAASYDSSQTTAPSQSSYNSYALVASNGQIGQGATYSARGYVYGNATLGPSGSVNSYASVSGTTTRLSSAIATPTLSTFTVDTNPGGVSSHPSVSSSVTWPGGTYYFSSLTIQANVTISFSGPATIYLNGTLTMGGTQSYGRATDLPEEDGLAGSGASWESLGKGDDGDFHNGHGTTCSGGGGYGGGGYGGGGYGGGYGGSGGGSWGGSGGNWGGGSSQQYTSLVAYNNIPANLVFYQSAGSTCTVNDNCIMVCLYDAPGVDFSAGVYFVAEGGIFARSIAVGDEASLFTDESAPRIVQVK